MRAYPKNPDEQPEELIVVKDETPKRREVIGGLLLGLGYMTFFPLPIALFLKFIAEAFGATPDLDVVTSIAQLISGVLVVCLMVFVVSKRTKKAIGDGFTRDNVLQGAITGAIMYLLSTLVAIALTAIYGEDISNANQDSLNALAQSAPLVYAALVCVVAPVVEEFIFRYYIYRPLERNTRIWKLQEGEKLTRKQYIINALLALIISTLLFAFIHLTASLASNTFAQDIKTWPAYVIPALPLGIIYFKTRKIAASITAHITYNTILVFLSFFASQASEVIGRLF